MTDHTSSAATGRFRDSSEPIPDANETVVETYDRVSGVYDRLVSSLSGRTRSRAIAGLELAGDERVLEVGCGPGRALTELAAALADTGRVYGLDAAPGMLERARRRCVRDGVTDRTELLLGDARRLPLADSSVDVAFVEYTLELFSAGDRERVLAELSRVLVPGGRLCVVTMEREGLEGAPFVELYDWAFGRVPGMEGFGCRPIYARRALEKGGFAVERIEREHRGGLWPVATLFARVGDESD